MKRLKPPPVGAVVTLFVSLIMLLSTKGYAEESAATDQTLVTFPEVLLRVNGQAYHFEDLVGMDRADFEERLNALLAEGHSNAAIWPSIPPERTKMGTRMPGTGAWFIDGAEESLYRSYVENQIQGLLQAFIQSQVAARFAEKYTESPSGYTGLSKKEYEDATRLYANVSTRLAASFAELERQALHDGHLSVEAYTNKMQAKFPGPNWQRAYKRYMARPRVAIVNDLLFKPISPQGDLMPWYEYYIQSGELNAHIQQYIVDHRETIEREAVRRYSDCAYIFVSGLTAEYSQELAAIAESWMNGTVEDPRKALHELAQQAKVKNPFIDFNPSIGIFHIEHQFRFDPKILRNKSAVGLASTVVANRGSTLPFKKEYIVGGMRAGNGNKQVDGLIWIEARPNTLQVDASNWSTKPGGYLFDLVLNLEVKEIYDQLLKETWVAEPFELLSTERFILVSRDTKLPARVAGVEIFSESEDSAK